MNKQPVFSLLRTRRFFPLLVSQFLGAFHDNIFKNAFVVLILFEQTYSNDSAHDAAIIATLAAGIFILPFVLFSSLGGNLANKFPKHIVIKATKIAEIPIAILGSAAIFSSSVHLSYATLFLLGTQSALFGPSRYAIMPEHLGKKELVAGNGLISAAIFLAILTGTIAGTALITQPDGKTIVMFLLFLCAFIGTFSSFFIPACRAQAPQTILVFNPFKTISSVLYSVWHQPPLFLVPIMGIGWFYFLGSFFLSQFPNYARSVLFVDEIVLTFFLTFFSIGIAAGGLINAWLLRNKTSTRYVPLAMLGITVFSIDLYFSSRAFGDALTLMNLNTFINQPGSIRILCDIALIALCGGLFQVPLNTILQQYAPAFSRADLLAASATINSIFIVFSSVFAAIVLSSGWAIHEVFVILAILNTIALFLFARFRASDPA